MSLRPAHKHFQATALCSEVSELFFFFFKYISCPSFFKEVAFSRKSIVIAGCVDVLQSSICVCFPFLGSAGTCLKLLLAGHHKLRTVVSLCSAIKVSKLEARFEAKIEAS